MDIQSDSLTVLQSTRPVLVHCYKKKSVFSHGTLCIRILIVRLLAQNFRKTRFPRPSEQERLWSHFQGRRGYLRI